LRYNEENAIYPEQVLISTKTDSTGYFKIAGKLLPNENMLYRIHCNLGENSYGLDFQETGTKKNYHNFIFSNSDTLFFPKENGAWFSNPRNTNQADKHWRKSIGYELSLLKELSENQNTDAIGQAKKNYLDNFKQYGSDSLSDPLVRLLAFAHIRRNVDGLNEDFKGNPEFYDDLLKQLDGYYSGKSYCIQFKEEISKFSASIIHQKYLFQKRLNYLLATIILSLLATLLVLLRKLRRRNKQETSKGLSDLSAQEKKIAHLVSEGKSNNEIAAQLYISLSTVKTHIGNINSKLNVTNRQELIAKLKNHTRD
jgi:DNA-binding CsgD family transcriptional regulator